MNPALADMTVLVLDCQATGASPQTGHLLEIGWAVFSADREPQEAPLAVETHLLQLPGGAALPRPVTRVTGIAPSALAGATSPGLAWQRLSGCARRTAAGNGLARCPTLIHFARYETPFLQDWHTRYEPDRPFPFEIACTHAMAQRLLPDLPRKGLRSVAGYLGHSLDRRRRSTDHVQATAHIWQDFVQRLHSSRGIDSWIALHAWLAGTPPPTAPRAYPLNPAFRQTLPDAPGIYRMRRSNGDLLYVGKATSLRKRVNSYFQPRARHPEHTLEMLSQARRLDVTTTASALEAAVLECDEIKQQAPPYNTALQQAERCLVFCSHDLTRLSAAADGSRLVGPLASPRTAHSLIALARWLADPERDPTGQGYAVLNMPENYQPPPETVGAGLALFYREHKSLLGSRHPLRAVTVLGARLWQARLNEARTVEDANGEDEDGHQDQAEPEWTPAIVQRAVEGIICHAAHLLRRARWMCLLCESTLSWQPRESGRPPHRVGIRQGRLIPLQHGPPQTPSAEILPIAHRRRNLDLATYDRLRVITTEIRRLLAEDRDVHVCLRPRGNLNTGQLRQLLRWV